MSRLTHGTGRELRVRGERNMDRRDEILAALRSASSVTAAARSIGVSRKLVYRWAERDDEIRARLEELRGKPPSARTVRRQRKRAAQTAAPDDPGRAVQALDALLRIALDEGVEPRDRVAAAKVILQSRPPAQKGAPTKPAAEKPKAEEPVSAEDVEARFRVCG